MYKYFVFILIFIWTLTPPTVFAKNLSVSDSISSQVRQGHCPGPETHTEIWQAADLQEISNQMLIDNGPHLKYRQCTDISIPSVGHRPVGLTTNAQLIPGGFQGEYLGNGFKIKNLAKDQVNTNHFGLFAQLVGATVKDLKLETASYQGELAVGILAKDIINSNIQDIQILEANLFSTHNDNGALAAIITDSVLKRIKISATTFGPAGLAQRIIQSNLEQIEIDITRAANSSINRFAGLAELMLNSEASFINAKIDAGENSQLQSVAGLIITLDYSSLYYAKLSNSIFPLIPAWRAGGLIAEAKFGSLIENVKVRASLHAALDAGGVVARASGTEILNASFTGSVSSPVHAGGIVGYAAPVVSNGQAKSAIIRRAAVRRATISGRQHAGAIVGLGLGFSPAKTELYDVFSDAHIQNPFPLLQDSELGGIVGTLWGEMNRALFAGTVAAGLGYRGCLIGGAGYDEIVLNAFYNSNLCALYHTVGLAYSAQELITNIDLYQNFDLDAVWYFNAGAMPGLRSIRRLDLDVNFDGLINVSDLFAFMALYFSYSIEADFDHNSLVDIVDLFAYLTAWFAEQ